MILLFQGRLLIFLLILNHRKAVFALFIINILFILFSDGGDLSHPLNGLRLTLTYMSLFFFLEIFHPTLYDSDAGVLEESLGSNTEEV